MQRELPKVYSNTKDIMVSINPFLDSAARYFTFVRSSFVTSLDSKASNVSEASFYPNPSKDLVTLKEDVSHIIVYNATGDMLLKGEKGLLNVASLPAGLYLVKVHYGKGNVSWQKLLKE